MILTNGDFNHQVQVSACAQAGVIGDQSRAPGASWVFPNSMSTLEKRSIHIPEKTWHNLNNHYRTNSNVPKKMHGLKFGATLQGINISP